MYQLIITEINNDADLKYFGKWIRDNYPDFTGFSVGSQVYINFSAEPSEADKTTIEDTYAALTTDDVLLPVEQSKLTSIGHLSFDADVETTLSGAVNDLDLPGINTCSRLLITLNGTTTLRGIKAPPAGVNQTLLIICISHSTLDLLKVVNEAGSSEPQNRIVNDNNKALTFKGGGGVWISYVHSQNRWFTINP